MKIRKNPLGLGAVALAFFLTATCIFEAKARPNVSVYADVSEKVVKDKFSGGWEYTVQGAPEGYEKGFLLIIGEKGQYQVQVQTGGGTFIGENVVAKKNTINFTLMVEGELVSVSLTVDGSKISGKSSSSQGDFMINGVKTLSQGQG